VERGKGNRLPPSLLLFSSVLSQTNHRCFSLSSTNQPTCTLCLYNYPLKFPTSAPHTIKNIQFTISHCNITSHTTHEYWIKYFSTTTTDTTYNYSQPPYAQIHNHNQHILVCAIPATLLHFISFHFILTIHNSQKSFHTINFAFHTRKNKL
jgi:hypothetical protein